MRTPLHYAMGVEKVETLSKILIEAGARRVVKDLVRFISTSIIISLKTKLYVYIFVFYLFNKIIHRWFGK